MREADYCRIPLLRRDGSVRGWTIVDPDDFEELSQFRWRLNDASSNHGKQGYAVRAHKFDDGRYRYQGMHRQLMGLDFGDPRQVDHANRDTLDNRRENLTVVSHAENMRNRPSHRGSTSRYRGVYFDKRKKENPWRARVRIEGRPVALGSFSDEREAGQAVYDYLTSIGWPIDPLEAAVG